MNAFPLNSIGLTGFVLVSVLNGDGSLAKTLPPIRNLWLDQGLDKLPEVLIADAFLVCAKGSSQAVTKESPAGGNTYSQASTTITRTGGTRDFTVNDVGKLVRNQNGIESVITAYTDATHVTVAQVGLLGLTNYSNKTIDLYSVQLTGLTSETYVTVTGETATKVEANATVTASNNVFQASDVGRAIFLGGDPGDPFAQRYTIATYVSATVVTVTSLAGAFTDRRLVIYTPQAGDSTLTPWSRTEDTSNVLGENGFTDTQSMGALTGERQLKRTFIFAPEPEIIEYKSTDDSGTFTWNATTVTRTAGARNFTTADVGKYLKFSTNEFCKITARSSNTVVTVDRAPAVTITSGTVTALYGGRSYDGLAFSESTDPDANANIIVRLEDGSGNSTPVFLLGPNPEFPGQQLKVTYVCKVTVAPVTITARANSGITDSGNVMGSNKFGTSVIEGLALSSIDSTGNTLTQYDALEPAVAAYLGISPNGAALVPLAGVDRSLGVVTTPMTAADYIPGTFSNLYEGTFGINDAVANNWKTIGIYDVDASAFAFTWLFETTQAKTGTVIITIRFRKSWNRNLA